ncbi:magnesium/cobalt transporter CorA [Streptosporangium roseum]|uniref:Magnesium transport protein CorA n=1 Tax=Streptosporangium roseum (strain ATCC 12428 / DSM 43021 / JCM 3005 / KCTC 9067 / NCIMB 10171 / NRRL 2505 / NI 9100) TaxID=479432 RepID=D2B111_STRRD|nr:magnesium/cobalt transporter CorA [Streptosporangium roseum]ACZ83418.1 putative metal ion transporter [Streptosporangium roseum DSM 43021]
MRSSLLFPRIKHARAVRAPHAPAVPVRDRVNGVCVPPSDSLVEYAAYIGGKKIDALGIPDALELVRTHNAAEEKTNAFVWVGLHEPDAPEVEWLAEVFALHPLAVEDAVKAHQRPKVERYGDSLFVVLKTVAYLDHDVLTATSEIIGTGEIMVFVGPDFVVTVRHGKHCPLSEVRERLEDKPKLLNRGPTGVLHAIADHVVDKYLNVADLMQAELEDVEAMVFADVSARDIGRIYNLKREMIEMKRSVTPLQSPMSTLAQRRMIPSEMREYFRDVVDHLARVCEQVESSNELCNSILQAALARSNALANEDMRKISSWVAIMAVPTMIAGIYGMNFDHMPELKSVFGYPIVIGVMVIACSLLYRGFRRNGWM